MAGAAAHQGVDLDTISSELINLGVAPVTLMCRNFGFSADRLAIGRDGKKLA
jgi:hypothetical protein